MGTTTPIIFDHTHAHCKTLRAAEKRTTKRQAEQKDEKNEKNRNFVKLKKVFPRLSNTIIIDNATLTRINASGIFLKSMNLGYCLAKVIAFLRLLTAYNTFVHCLPY